MHAETVVENTSIISEMFRQEMSDADVYGLERSKSGTIGSTWPPVCIRRADSRRTAAGSSNGQQPLRNPRKCSRLLH